MLKFLQQVFVLFICTLLIVSCSEKDDISQLPQSVTNGVYVLNEGDWGANNSEITYYNPQTGETATNIFFNANGKLLGDTANDMVIYGSKMYIAVSSSAVIFVTDLQGKVLSEMHVAGTSAYMSPRQFDCANGKVYVTFMEGYVGAIDTTDYSISTVEVGPMPEGIAYMDGKIYVANSDGYNPNYGNTVSVIDAKSFTVEKTLQVGTNPQNFCKSLNRELYLVCWGNYSDKPAILQKINTTTDEVVTIPNVEPNQMSIGANGLAYILSSFYDENWNQTIKYFTYSLTTDSIVGEFTTTSLVPNGYSINVDPNNGNIYIGCSDYVSNGDVYILSPNGEILGSFDTGAINPAKVCFNTEIVL